MMRNTDFAPDYGVNINCSSVYNRETKHGTMNIMDSPATIRDWTIHTQVATESTVKIFPNKKAKAPQ
jgi:hypothetical protein